MNSSIAKIFSFSFYLNEFKTKVIDKIFSLFFICQNIFTFMLFFKKISYYDDQTFFILIFSPFKEIFIKNDIHIFRKCFLRNRCFCGLIGSDIMQNMWVTLRSVELCTTAAKKLFEALIEFWIMWLCYFMM